MLRVLLMRILLLLMLLLLVLLLLVVVLLLHRLLRLPRTRACTHVCRCLILLLPAPCGVAIGSVINAATRKRTESSTPQGKRASPRGQTYGCVPSSLMPVVS